MVVMTILVMFSGNALFIFKVPAKSYARTRIFDVQNFADIVCLKT